MAMWLRSIKGPARVPYDVCIEAIGSVPGDGNCAVSSLNNELSRIRPGCVFSREDAIPRLMSLATMSPVLLFETMSSFNPTYVFPDTLHDDLKNTHVWTDDLMTRSKPVFDDFETYVKTPGNWLTYPYFQAASDEFGLNICILLRDNGEFNSSNFISFTPFNREYTPIHPALWLVYDDGNHFSPAIVRVFEMTLPSAIRNFLVENDAFNSLTPKEHLILMSLTREQEHVVVDLLSCIARKDVMKLVPSVIRGCTSRWSYKLSTYVCHPRS